MLTISTSAQADPTLSSFITSANYIMREAAEPVFVDIELNAANIDARLIPRQAEFERLIAKYSGRKHGIAVSSDTSGLHLLTRA